VEHWRHAADVEAWWYGALSFWRLAVGVATWRCRCIEAWSPGSLEAPCGRSDVEVEVRSAGGALQACRRRSYGAMELKNCGGSL